MESIAKRERRDQRESTGYAGAGRSGVDFIRMAALRK